MKTAKDDFYKKLLTLVLPIAFQQFMPALVSASDALMLGDLHQNALSAVSLAGQIAFAENLFLAAMTIGLSMLAAQYWGKGDKSAVERIFAYVMKITSAVSFLFFLAGLCAPGLLMKIFTNDGELISFGAVYIRTASPSYLLTGISQIYLCILKNSGKAGKAGLISSASVAVNIALNALLIFGLFSFPKMGISGAALATVMARVTETFWCILEASRKNSVKLKIRNVLHNDKILRKDFWKYTAPVLGNEMVWGVGFTMYSVIMGHLGSDAVAANSIANIVKNLTACFCIGIGSGGGIMVGNELGAGRLSLVSGFITGGLLLLLSPFIFYVTDLREQADTYLKQMLWICSYYMIGKSINATTIGGIFCAGGDSKFGFLCDTVTMWCITVPLGFISAFVLRLPVTAVYFIVSLDEIIKLPAVYRHYKKYKWIKDLTVKE